jgi:hypothetical protein
MQSTNTKQLEGVEHMVSRPAGYRAIDGSERRHSPAARQIGPINPEEVFSVTVVLRRRPDGPPPPGYDYFLKVPPHRRQRVPNGEFARRYGAAPADIAQITGFAKSHQLTVVAVNEAGRTVKLRGTAAHMGEAFAVEFARYEHTVDRGRGQKRTETYRGRQGFVYVPAALHSIIVGVFGLDSRGLGRRAGNPEPPHTGTLDVSTVARLYNYPTNSAAGQTIGILSFGGYEASDITSYFAGIGATAPVITDIDIDGTINSGGADGETTQDIQIAAAFAPGAAINVYFFDWSTSGQMHWVDALTRVAHPEAGDTPCTVLSSSDYITDGDDAGGLDFGATLAQIAAIDLALQDCAIQGVTVCFCTADFGSAARIGDGQAHTCFPASDPWVLAVGGTTIGNINGNSFDEYVWNDPQAGNWGTTGGGVSRYFPVPGYQSEIAIPASISQPAFRGRGIPDVAGNANVNSGYNLILGGSASVGNGTSASTPQWAGLIAVINAALGVNLGFVNPAIYALGSSVFRDIVPGAGPADNGNSGVAGYPAGPGWDACTGWGSPNGQALLDGLRTLYTRSLYFVVDKNTYGADEVGDAVAHAGGLFSSAFWLVLEGFSINELGGTQPDLSGAFAGFAFLDASSPTYEDASDLYTPQRIRFAYNVIFTHDALLNDFPATGAPPTPEPLLASITVGAAAPLAATALFELTAGADPYFTNVNPANQNVFYLSQDLRVFSSAAGDSPLPGAPAFTSDPYQSIQSLLHFMNNDARYTAPGIDRLSGLPGQSGYETADSSVIPLNGAGHRNYNFAIARVRLQDAASATAPDVRVFFRLFVAPSCDTDFDPNGTYKRQTGTGAQAGLPVFPLPSGNGLVDPSGNSVKTIPFFATDASGTHDYDGTAPDANIRTIAIPAIGDKTWAYFGCYLDVFDASNQSLFPGTHHCIVAEIAYDTTPIVNSNGVTLSPENTDKLAQRNLQITPSGNPGYPDTHRIPQAFDTRVSAPPQGQGDLLDYPDELMIDWGNVPPGSTASIYWPQADAQAIIDLATRLYGAHRLDAADAHTISCRSTAGVTYVPIPFGEKVNLAGLFTVDLPAAIHVGQEFNARVRRVTSRRAPAIRAEPDPTHGPVGDFAGPAPGKRHVLRNWRYVTGTFQIKIPVGNDGALLRPEESTLAILEWRLRQMKPQYRWRPVLERLISYVSKRVDGFGGNAAGVKPSLTGLAPASLAKERLELCGKVSAVIYDRFGDFEGFLLDTAAGERRFAATEHPFEDLVRRAWADRIFVCVVADKHEPHRPLAIEYWRMSRHHGDK